LTPADTLRVTLPDQCKQPPESPLVPAVLIEANVKVRLERFDVTPKA
jgi:hypothetical protein